MVRDTYYRLGHPLRRLLAQEERLLLRLALLGWALLAVLILSLRVGSVPIGTATALAAFTDFDPTSNEHLIVRTLRFPRTIIGLGVGAALATAGAVMQAVTRNALASPAILGINAGAAFAIVTAIFLVGIVTPLGYIWFAFAGALITAVLVYVIGSLGPSGATPVKLALAGAVVTALMGSWISAILVLNQRTLDEIRFWLAGSIAGRDLDTFLAVMPFLAVGLFVCWSLGRQLNALSLGEEISVGLGQRASQVRWVSAVAVVLLAGGAVAVAGPVGFVGLTVPHIARRLFGTDYRWVLASSAVLGAIMLVGSDVLGRVILRPGEIQVGIVTAVVGAPFLIYVVRRRRLMAL